jgi:hypothetical protein
MPTPTKLEVLLSCMTHGYAHDLTRSIMDGEGTDQDADSLFRTLVLDHDFTVDEARELYEEAIGRIVSAEEAQSKD